MAKREAEFVPVELNKVSNYLERYRRLVSSASDGAIMGIPKE